MPVSGVSVGMWIPVLICVLAAVKTVHLGREHPLGLRNFPCSLIYNRLHSSICCMQLMLSSLNIYSDPPRVAGHYIPTHWIAN